jgi:hypothetical protein
MGAMNQTTDGELKQQLKHVESTATVIGGKLVGEYDFYKYLEAFEGKDVIWTLELAKPE